MNGLKIVVGSGDEKQAELARRIMPIRGTCSRRRCGVRARELRW
jgi:hypothetical protein